MTTKRLQAPGLDLSKIVGIVGIANGGTNADTAPVAVDNLGGLRRSTAGQANKPVPIGSNGKIDISFFDAMSGNYVSLTGPNSVVANEVAIFNITNYDSWKSYTVSATVGTVSKNGSVITYTAPATGTNCGFTVNGRNIDLSIIIPGISYSLSMVSHPSYSINEGETLTFKIVTTGIADNTNLTYDISSAGTATGSDFNASGTTLPSGIVSIVNNETNNINILIRADSLTEGSENFYIRVYNGGTLVYTSSLITINDTSLSSVVATYGLTLQPDGSNNTGSQLTESYTGGVTVNTTNVPYGTSLYFRFLAADTNGTTSGDFISLDSGSVSITNNTGNIGLFVSADQVQENQFEYFTVQLATDASFNDIVASLALSIQDTSFMLAGWLSLVVGGFGDYSKQIIQQPDGKYLILGHYDNYYFRNNTYNGGGDLFNVYVMRLNANGSIDASFATNGVIKLSTLLNAGFSGKEYPVKILLNPSNKIIVVCQGGGVNNANTLVQFNTNGTIDTAFGDNGVASVTVPDNVYSPQITLYDAVIHNNYIYCCYYINTGVNTGHGGIIKLNLSGIIIDYNVFYRNPSYGQSASLQLIKINTDDYFLLETQDLGGQIILTKINLTTDTAYTYYNEAWGMDSNSVPYNINTINTSHIKSIYCNNTTHVYHLFENRVLLVTDSNGDVVTNIGSNGKLTLPNPYFTTIHYTDLIYDSNTNHIYLIGYEITNQQTARVVICRLTISAISVIVDTSFANSGYLFLSPASVWNNYEIESYGRSIILDSNNKLVGVSDNFIKLLSNTGPNGKTGSPGNLFCELGVFRTSTAGVLDSTFK